MLSHQGGPVQGLGFSSGLGPFWLDLRMLCCVKVGQSCGRSGSSVPPSPHSLLPPKSRLMLMRLGFAGCGLGVRDLGLGILGSGWIYVHDYANNSYVCMYVCESGQPASLCLGLQGCRVWLCGFDLARVVEDTVFKGLRIPVPKPATILACLPQMPSLCLSPRFHSKPNR